MASKALLVFAALLAVVLLVSSEVAAGELAEEAQEKNVNKAGIEEQKYPYGGGYPGGGYPGRGYGGYPGGGYGGYPGRGNGGYPGRGGYCRWGCCRRGYYGGCQCCAHPDEIPEPMYQPEVHN